MMGTRQKLKTGMEVDFIFARSIYCYLKNNRGIKKFIKKTLSRRRRQEAKHDLYKSTAENY